MNILLINHYAGSYKHGMEYRPFYLAREWMKLGHQVTIVAASHSHVRTQAPDIADDLTAEEIEGVRYIWLKTPPYQGNNLHRLWNILTFIGQLFRYWAYFVQQIQPDVVINSSTYPLDTYPAQFIAHKAKAKLIFEVHDLWPLSPIELGGMSPRHPFIILMQQAENSAYRTSDNVVSLLPKAKIYMQAHGMAAHKFVYLPNGIDIDEWKLNQAPLPAEHQRTISALKQSGHFLIGYAGGHGLANALSFLIDAAASLRHYQSLTFILVGQGPEKAALQQQVTHLGLTNIVFLRTVPKCAVPALLQEMDALFIGWQKLPIYRFGISPNKLMDYMMAAKPIIHALSAGNDPVAESGCGISVPAENSQAIVVAIQQLMHQPIITREAMGKRGRDYVMAHHDYTILAKQFLAVMAHNLSFTHPLSPHR
jgi:glycosyltransferase involved in cell wall biosynthesis